MEDKMGQSYYYMEGIINVEVLYDNEGNYAGFKITLKDNTHISVDKLNVASGFIHSHVFVNLSSYSTPKGKLVRNLINYQRPLEELISVVGDIYRNNIDPTFSTSNEELSKKFFEIIDQVKKDNLGELLEQAVPIIIDNSCFDSKEDERIQMNDAIIYSFNKSKHSELSLAISNKDPIEAPSHKKIVSKISFFDRSIFWKLTDKYSLGLFCPLAFQGIYEPECYDISRFLPSNIYLSSIIETTIAIEMYPEIFLDGDKHYCFMLPGNYYGELSKFLSESNGNYRMGIYLTRSNAANKKFYWSLDLNAFADLEKFLGGVTITKRE